MLNVLYWYEIKILQIPMQCEKYKSKLSTNSRDFVNIGKEQYIFQI